MEPIRNSDLRGAETRPFAGYRVRILLQGNLPSWSRPSGMSSSDSNGRSRHRRPAAAERHQGLGVCTEYRSQSLSSAWTTRDPTRWADSSEGINPWYSANMLSATPVASGGVQ